MSQEKKSKLLTKVSPLIEGQVPDFVRDDHPLFVDFLKDYYQFLEAGKLEINVTTDYVKLETTTSAYVLLEDGNRVVDESSLQMEKQLQVQHQMQLLPFW